MWCGSLVLILGKWQVYAAVEDVFEMARCAVASIIALFSIASLERIVLRLRLVC